MSKSKKILTIVLSILGALILGLGIWYLVAPRDFLQTLLPDNIYASITLVQNGERIGKKIEKMADEGNALYIDGSLNADIEASLLLGSEDAAKALSDYAKTLTFDGNIYFADDASNIKIGLKDKDGTILSGEAILSEDIQCFKIDQFDLGWQSVEKDNSKKGTSSKTTDANIDLSKAKIDIVKEQEMKIGDIKAKGEVVTIKMDADTFKSLINGLIAASDEDDYKAEMQKFQSSIVSFLDENEVKQITSKFFINKRNHIVATSIDFEGKENKNISFVVSEDDNYAVEYKTSDFLVDAQFAFKKTAYESFKVPSKSEISVLDKEALKNAAVNYFIGDFLSTHKDLKNAFASLIKPLLTQVVQEIFGGMSGSEGLGSLTSNIFGDSFKGNTDNASDFISNIFSMLA